MTVPLGLAEGSTEHCTHLGHLELIGVCWSYGPNQGHSLAPEPGVALGLIKNTQPSEDPLSGLSSAPWCALYCPQIPKKFLPGYACCHVAGERVMVEVP